MAINYNLLSATSNLTGSGYGPTAYQGDYIAAGSAQPRSNPSYSTQVPYYSPSTSTQTTSSTTNDFIGPRRPAVLGTSTSQPQPKGSGGRQPTQNPPQQIDNNNNAPTIDQRIFDEANNIYNAIMGYANQAESFLRSAQPEIEARYNRTAQQNRDIAQTQYDQSGRALTTAETEAGQRRDTAINQGRQTLAESKLGYGQRFGAAGPIASALGEYATTKFQQSADTARNIAEQTYQKINEQRRILGENFTNVNTQINNWLADSLTTAKQEFTNKLMEIGSMRAGAEENRSKLRIDALTALSNATNAYKAQAEGFKQQLIAQAQAADLRLRNQSNALAQYGTNANTIGTSNAEQNAFNILNIPGVNQVGTATPTTTYTGIRSKNQDEYGL